MDAPIVIGIAFGESRHVPEDSLGTHVLEPVEGIVDEFRPAFR